MLLESIIIAPLMYGAALGADVASSRAALRSCAACYEIHSGFNTGEPKTAALVGLGLTGADYALGRSKSKTLRSMRWGLRVGALVFFGSQALQNQATARKFKGATTR